MSETSGGIGLGCLIAVIISLIKWGHIGWAILHGILGWIYVIYFLITYGAEIAK
jgi:hypothetical protein